jgi:hypothetical protein
MESYKGLSRATLLERLAGYANPDALSAMSDNALLAEYCEGMVASSKMFPGHTPGTEIEALSGNAR